MKMGELCNRDVVITTADEAVKEAARRMREHHVGCLVVVEQRQDGAMPVAVITDRDLVVAALADDDARPEKMTVADAMSSGLVVAREEDDLYDVVQRMRAHGVRRVPVVDGKGRLQGIFTFDDILELLSEELESLTGLLQREQHRERNARARLGS